MISWFQGKRIVSEKRGQNHPPSLGGLRDVTEEEDVEGARRGRHLLPSKADGWPQVRGLRPQACDAAAFHSQRVQACTKMGLLYGSGWRSSNTRRVLPGGQRLIAVDNRSDAQFSGSVGDCGARGSSPPVFAPPRLFPVAWQRSLSVCPLPCGAVSFYMDVRRLGESHPSSARAQKAQGPGAE